MSTLTAGEVVARMKANHGMAWNERSKRDTFKFGGPDTVVKGIATAMFCSYQVLERAVAAGCNMIVPHEDTFWRDDDVTTTVSGDPGYAKKMDFLREHDMVIFRFHDNMHAMGKADFSYIGLARALGITQYETTTLHHFLLPETTLGELAATFQKRLGDKALRVVGDPKTKLTRLQLGVGYATPNVNAADVDVVVSGELQETDGMALDDPEYVLDANTLGIAKGWIMLGHHVSEEQGMLETAQWIKSIVPEVQVQLVKGDEPFWGPK